MSNPLELTPEQKADAARLTALYQHWKASERERGGNGTQESAAHTLGMSQSAFSQYCRGIRPLNAELLIKLQQAFGWEPAEVSPSIASKMQSMAAATGVGASFEWPFDRIDLRKIQALGKVDLDKLQDGIVFIANELGIDIQEAKKSEQVAM